MSRFWECVAQIARLVLEYAELRSMPEQTIVEQIEQRWRLK